MHDLFYFLRLRADPHAQYEIRANVEAISTAVRDWVPLAYRAFLDYQQGGATLSAGAWTCLRRMLKGEEVTQETSGLTVREWRKLKDVIT